ncbi:unnamed protein product [Caenorhabditis angaria]|uniref:UDP-glucuronosyltransferase n=1 Tax=Caenorhabditis angaria TaxID=860376 RepID=A0A9P1IUW1_9PELO|nr:unnamed protein product [Caenorhabditis angaria]
MTVFSFFIVSLLLFLQLFISFCDGGKLLLSVMDQGRSHATSFTPLMHRLQKDNHTTALQFAIFQEDIDFGMEERFINMSDFDNPFFSPNFARLAFDEEYNFIDQAKGMGCGSVTCGRILEHRRKEFFKLADEDWDFILTDSLFSACGYGLAKVTNKPHIMMHSTALESGLGTFKSYGANHALVVPNLLPYAFPNFNVSYFHHRALSAYDWMGQILFTVFFGDIAQKYALRSIIPFPWFSYYDYNRESVFSFTDMPEQLYQPFPRTNDYFAYGAYCKSISADLPTNIKNFIEDPKSKGTIIIAFGTFIDWRTAPRKKYEIFRNVVNKLSDYRVIWSMRGDRPEGLGEHVLTAAWIPQNALLLHNKTKLFVSHGGLKSVKETVCSATPTVFMPMFAEQMRNAWLVKEKGFGKIINKFYYTERSLETNVREILKNPYYQKSASKFKSIYLDQPIANLDEAAFKFKKLFDYNGKLPNYFYSRGLQLSYFTTLNLDLLFVIPMFLVYIVFKK